MQCTDCSHDLIEKSLFCDDCGLARAAMVQDDATLRIYCGKCGTRLQGEKKYCIQCGEPSPVAGEIRKATSFLRELLSNPKVQFLLLGVCLAVVAGPLLYFIVMQTEEPVINQVTAESVAASISTGPKDFTASQAHLEAMRLAGLQLKRLSGVAKSGDGTIYVADSVRHMVHKLGTDGKQTVVAGTGEAGYSGDSGPARDAMLNRPHGLMIDEDGNLFIADSGNQVVRMVDRRGKIRTIAGVTPGEPFKPGRAKDAARQVTLLSPIAVGLGLHGEIYVAEDPNADGPRPPSVWVLEPDNGSRANRTERRSDSLAAFSRDTGPPQPKPKELP